MGNPCCIKRLHEFHTIAPDGRRCGKRLSVSLDTNVAFANHDQRQQTHASKFHVLVPCPVLALSLAPNSSLRPGSLADVIVAKIAGELGKLVGFNSSLNLNFVLEIFIVRNIVGGRNRHAGITDLRESLAPQRLSYFIHKIIHS